MDIKPIATNIAADALITTQTGITEIKQVIVKAVMGEWAESETTKQLNGIIAKTVNGLKGELLKESVRRALVTAARRWHWQTANTMQILNRNIASNAQVQDAIYSIGILEVLANSTKSAIEALRPYLDYSRVQIVPVIESYQQSVKIAMRALATETPKTIQRRDGKAYTMPLRNYAEMTVRYEANLANVQDLVDSGVDLVWISSHPNASPRCAPYQGQLYSTRNESGTVDGIRYTPLQKAMAGENDDGNGIISGYNCRHRLIPYTKGSRAPEEYTEREIKREYAIDQMQRNYENRIRHLKTESALLREAGEVDEARQLSAKARYLTKEYQAKSIKANRAYYPYRYIVDKSEVEYESKTA